MYYKIFFFVILICMGKAIAQPIEQNYLFNPPPAQDPTYFNDIKPENVLVVYKRPNDVNDTLGNISREIKDYYVSKRGIPSINIVKVDGDLGLPLPDIQYYNGESVVLSQDREIIKRNHPCADDGNNGICDTLAFYYYYEKIALPITNYLNNTIDPNTGNYLKDQIHYIVLCKGIPLKIKSADYGWVEQWQSYHIAIDGLLCLLKTNNNNNPSIMKLYPPTTNIYYKCKVENPYNGIDLDFNFNNRFKANHYFVNKTLNDNTSAQFKITCLVSRLDGRNQQEVIDLIDKSYTPDKSGEGTWILDGHYFYSWETVHYQGYNSYNQSTIVPTASKLSQYGFNVYCDTTSRLPIYSYSSPVAGYLSWGRHAGYPIGFVVDNLSFDLRPGSVYNTLESYNGASMQSIYRVNEQSLLSEYIQNEGTSGVGHTYEPYLGPNNNPFNFFPAYAMGYNIVEAAYQGIEYLAWQNIVIGDPLTTIAWGKQSLTENKTLTGTNLVTGVVTVPSGKTLTVAANAVLNFKHSGSLIVNGNLTIGHDAVLNFYNGSTIVVNGTLTIEDNLTIPAGAALTMKLGSVFNFGNSLTINGTLNLEDVITLPVGSTLTFNQGANATFTEYASLIVCGTLIASGATFDLAPGESHNWGSILFDGYETSSSILDNVVINNATNIQVLNSAYITIQNSIIQDCVQGIYVYDAFPQIAYNQIVNPLYHGIYFDNCGMARAFGNTITKTNKQNQGIVVYGATESYIAQNNISGFGHGIYIGSTDAFFTDDGFQSPYPNNLLTNNYYGVMVGWGSFLCAGWDESHGGDNSIYSNDSYDIYVYQFSNANASYNYWGSGDPNQYVDGTSYLEVLPILTSNPWGYQSAIKLITSDETLTPESQQINTKAKSTSATQDVGTSKGLLTQVQTTQLNYNQGTAKDDDEFLKGIKLKKEGQIDEAIEQLKKVVKDKKYGLYAITELAGIKTRYGKENIQPYFEDLVKEPNAENKSRIKKALAGFYLSNNEDDRALVIYDELKDSKSSKRDNFEGLYEKFNVMLHKKKDLETAKTLLAELKNKFADDADAMIHISTAEVLMSGKRTPAFGKKQSGSEVSTEVEAPKEYALFNNYPNPFNPVTTISYQLPKDGFVTLKVFDILGNELITLVNDQRSAGTYTMHFDASSLSSGMYVYQLRVNDYTSTKKMLLLK